MTLGKGILGYLFSFPGEHSFLHNFVFVKDSLLPLSCCFLGLSYHFTFQPANMHKLLICIRKQLNWTVRMLYTGPTVHLHTLNGRNMVVPYRMLQRLSKLILNIQRHVCDPKSYVITVQFKFMIFFNGYLLLTGLLQARNGLSCHGEIQRST